MDYLRTLGSAAVSSIVQKSGLNLPFTLGPKIEDDPKNAWALHDGTKRDDGSPVSIFVYDFNTPGRKNTSLARNALRKLRTIRHPDVLKFMDAVEADHAIYIMTERVRPLASSLKAQMSKNAQDREDWLLWGLHRISVALAFINESASSTHGYVRISSVFISPSGEWKLGGFEVLSNPKDDAAVLYTLGRLLPEAMSHAPPEAKKSGWSILKDQNPAATDAYALGLLLHSVFNPTHPLPPTTEPPHPPPTAASRGSIPASLFPSYKKLLNPNPKARMTPKGFLELGMAETAGDGSGFFAHNRLVKVCAGLDNFNLSSDAEKAMFLRTLKESASSFPVEFASHKVLPSLVSALEFGGASANTILPLVLQFGANVPPQDYPDIILGPLLKLYASPDRGTRMALLDHLPEYAEHLDKKMVADKVWPNLQTGFTDTVAVIREATVKSIILLAPKFNERIMNNDLLRYLAKAQSDLEPSIRTNTCILIGRLAPSLGYHTKRKVLVPAFTKALKDPFVHARVAALMAFMASVDCFEIEDLAAKVIPNVSPALVDKEKLVRDQAFKAIELLIKKIETYAASMPDTAIVEGDNVPGGLTQAPAPEQTTLVSSAAGAAGALAGWAISSLGKSLATSEMKSPMTVQLDRPTSAPPPPLNTIGSRPGPQPFVLSMPSSAFSAMSSPEVVVLPSSARLRAKGMQLGANKVPAGVSSAALAAELAEEAAAADGLGGGSNPWGSDDLMDVNADEDDWTAFEEAPVPLEAHKPVSATRNGLTHGKATADDPWGDINTTSAHVETDLRDAPRAQPSFPSLSTQPREPSQNSTITSASSSRRSTPVPLSPPLPTSPSVPTVSTAGMTKEEKAAEMQRRKEERKQRIAALKEQKKHATGAKA